MAENTPKSATAANAVACNRVSVALEDVQSLFVSEPISLSDGRTVIFHSDGNGVRPFVVEPTNPVLPDAVTASETFIEPESFIEYLMEFRMAPSVIKASLSGNRFVCTIDYHEGASEDGRPTPGTASHFATLQCPYDRDYATWKKTFDQLFTQVAFADFLEDMVHTIASPAAADLLDAIREVNIDRAVKTRSVVRQNNGTIAINFEEVDTQASGSFVLPQEVVIVVPIFQGTQPVRIVTKLRYALEKGVILFKLVAPGLDKLERDEFRKIGDDVRRVTSIPVYYGA